MDSAYGTGVTLDVPAPHGHGVPFLQSKHLIVLLIVAIDSVTRVLFGIAHGLRLEMLAERETTRGDKRDPINHESVRCATPHSTHCDVCDTRTVTVASDGSRRSRGRRA